MIFITMNLSKKDNLISVASIVFMILFEVSFKNSKFMKLNILRPSISDIFSYLFQIFSFGSTNPINSENMTTSASSPLEQNPKEESSWNFLNLLTSDNSAKWQTTNTLNKAKKYVFGLLQRFYKNPSRTIYNDAPEPPHKVIKDKRKKKHDVDTLSKPRLNFLFKRNKKNEKRIAWKDTLILPSNFLKAGNQVEPIENFIMEFFREILSNSIFAQSFVDLWSKAEDNLLKKTENITETFFVNYEKSISTSMYFVNDRRMRLNVLPNFYVFRAHFNKSWMKFGSCLITYPSDHIVHHKL